MDTTPEYGLDKELKQKQAAKYDVVLEKQVTEWIEAVSGEKRGDQTFAEWLKNGQVLCKLANVIRPGIVKKTNTSSLAFKQMENITFFMNAARELGVPEYSMFGTPDLYEEKNIFSVVQTIYALGGAIQVSCPDFQGPKLGIELSVESKDKKRDTGPLTDQSAGFSTTMEVEKPIQRADYCVKPSSTPRSSEKKVTENETPEKKPLRSAQTISAQSPPKVDLCPDLQAPVVAPALPHEKSEEAIYGLDKELRDKQNAKYDVVLEKEVTGWIEAVSNEKKGDQTFAEWLKNGQVLCALANAIRPGIVKKTNASSLPFKQMENITFFMNAARDLGVPEYSMFGTPDLYEAKNIFSVVQTIYALGGAIQVSCPDFQGPKLGVEINVESKDKKRNSAILTDQSAGFSTNLEVQRPNVDPLR